MRELPDYRFRYLDNHASLYRGIARQPPAHFVLNFCDEGFNNDAFMELHVPALLEMLGIPYSGAGPACLGLCYNKSLVRGIAEAIDVPVPAETYFNSDDFAATIPSVFPALIKPNATAIPRSASPRPRSCTAGRRRSPASAICARRCRAGRS